MRRLRLLLIRWLAGRDFIDPQRHPVLSRYPQILGCVSQSWKCLADLALVSHSPFLGKWYLVSLGYSEESAKEMGVPVATVMRMKEVMIEKVGEAARESLKVLGG